MDKVPTSARFLDFSDYTRPIALALVRVLLPTPVTPLHVTLAFVLVGTAAAALFAGGRWLALAGVLLVVKATLDGVDGSLARARARPSRVGRFADSIGDFWVNLLVYLAIGWRWSVEIDRLWPIGLASIALLSGMLQVSTVNYYSLLYRQSVGGDRTSKIRETEGSESAWEDPATVRASYRLYRWIYGWQDGLIAALDRLLAPGAPVPGPGFLSASTVMGLGTQLGVIALCALFGLPEIGILLLATLFNVYAAGLFVLRGAAARTRIEGQGEGLIDHGDKPL